MNVKKSFKSLPWPHLLVDALAIFISLYLSLWLRLGWQDLHIHLDAVNNFAPLFLIIRIFTFYIFRVYSAMWRYVSTVDATNLARALAVSAVLFIAIAYFIPQFGLVPRSFFFIDAFCCGALLMGVRLFRRHVFEKAQSKKSGGTSFSRVIIYGAGQNGRVLAQRIKSDSSLGLELVGFLDDDPTKQGKRIQGYRVYGNNESLEQLIEQTQATEIIIAVTNPSGELVRNIMLQARPFNIKPRVVTDLRQIGPQRKNFDIYRELNLSDLLGRQAADIDLPKVRQLIQGKKVLVTGAGGSIGSELARQIAQHNPSKLMLLDHSEYNLYQIDNELRISANETHRIVPLLIDIKDRKSLEIAMKQHSPDLVFHAAAYKHVHLVETNPYSAILNNVYGTRNLLEVSEDIDVENFVLISTDKAVNPAGVMGATKRVCELLTTAAGIKTQKPYCSVRFGNVLGSSGSLIPLLKSQIEEGGPVTVTHPDMNRFFMLIPEAVSLVLMAASQSQSGDINVLRMGEPVKIVDIAKNLITLMGRTEEEVPIVFTGIRPGEKMYEELYLNGNERETDHPDILTLPDGDLGVGQTKDEIQDLKEKVIDLLSTAEKGEKEALFHLNDLIKSKYQTENGELPPFLRGLSKTEH